MKAESDKKQRYDYQKAIKGNEIVMRKRSRAKAW
jgi:hypothetical protein